MADWLAIVWDAPHLTAVRLDPAGPREVDSLRVDLPDAPAAEQTAFAADAFKEIAAGCAAVTAVLPRDRTTWRRLAVPPVTDGELAPIVRLQFATRVAGGGEPMEIDFLPPGDVAQQGVRDAAGQSAAASEETSDQPPPREVIAVAIPKATVGRVAELADALALPLRGIFSSPTALLEVAARTGFQPAAAVAAGERYAETMVLDDGRLREARGRRCDGRNIDGEKNRAELSGGGLVIPLSLDGVSEEIEQLSAAGAVLAAAGAETPQLNFLSPRQEIAPPDRRRTLIFGAAGLAAALVLGVGWSTWSEASSLSEEIEAKRTRLTEVKAFLRDKGEVREHRADIEDHLAARPDATAVTSTVLAALPARERLILGEFHLTPSTGSVLARLKGHGYAVTRRDVESFTNALAAAGYDVPPAPVFPSEERPSYPLRFTFDIEIPVPKDAA